MKGRVTLLVQGEFNLAAKILLGVVLSASGGALLLDVLHVGWIEDLFQKQGVIEWLTVSLLLGGCAFSVMETSRFQRWAEVQPIILWGSIAAGLLFCAVGVLSWDSHDNILNTGTGIGGSGLTYAVGFALTLFFLVVPVVVLRTPSVASLVRQWRMPIPQGWQSGLFFSVMFVTWLMDSVFKWEICGALLSLIVLSVLLWPIENVLRNQLSTFGD